MDCKAYTQAYYIIENLSYEIKSKIPDKIINAIKSKMDITYDFKIDDENIENMQLLEDTEKLLSVIYTDYIANEDEKTVIRNKELFLLKEKERIKKEEYSEKYKSNIFEKQEVIENKKTMDLITVPKEKWYQKILSFFKKILKK